MRPRASVLTALLLAAAVCARAAAPVVAVDAGHGGNDRGQMLRGVVEAQLSLVYARRAQAALKADGLMPYLTRWKDSYVALTDRVLRAEQVGARVFVSFHADNSRRSGRGVVVWVYGHNKRVPKGPKRQPGERILPPPPPAQVAASRRLAELIQRELRRRGVKVTSYADRGAFAVLKGPRMASVLLEVGNLHDKREARLIQRPAYQAKVVAA
ncbi:MAG: N-acetylmuramoyl-L-alanine amidase, partial [Elusimicrobia bacterium]|nr:N-acetylmuramoyl-L-alanine amidase [Elusimicrobiota bacterium]